MERHTYLKIGICADLPGRRWGGSRGQTTRDAIALSYSVARRKDRVLAIINKLRVPKDLREVFRLEREPEQLLFKRDTFQQGNTLHVNFVGRVLFEFARIPVVMGATEKDLATLEVPLVKFKL